MPDTVSFWVAIGGWIATLVGGSVWTGKQHQRISTVEKVIEKCGVEKLMTEEKCERTHVNWQATSNVILSNIQKSIDGMASDIKQISGNQHQRQVDFARMTEQMATLSEKMGALSVNGYTMKERNGMLNGGGR